MLPRKVLVGSVLGAAGWLELAAVAQVPDSQPATQPAGTETSAPTTAPALGWPQRILDVRDLALELGVEGGYDERSVHSRTSNPLRPTDHQLDRATRFEETFGIRSLGALFDENTALYDIAATYGLSQDWYSERSPWEHRDEWPHGDLYQYDVNFTAFPRGMISANGYAQRLDSRVPRTFQPSLDRTFERYGADVLLNHPTLPMRFSFEHTWDELTSRTRDLLDDEQRGHDSFRYAGTWQPSKNHALHWEYEYTDRHERYSGSQTRYDTTRHYALLNHVLRFGPDDRSSLETLLRYQDEAGDLARDNAEFSSRLRLQHTDKLATNFAVQYLRDSFAELTTSTWRGEAGLTYQFDPALLAALQLYGAQTQADANADFAEWGGLASLAYAKDNPWGRFSTNLSYHHSNIQARNNERRGVVVAEAVTLRDPLWAYLAQTDVDVGTLIVTDGKRTRTYLPGRDYLAVKLGRYTALQRRPSGQIADGETVLATYTYDVSDNYGIARDRFDLRIQQEFRFGLTPYYAGSLQDERYDQAQFRADRDRNVNRHRLGATYRRKLWSAGLEYEYNDDAIDPYQAVHFNGDVVLWQKAQQQLDAKTTISRFWFSGVDEREARDTTLFDVGSSYRYLLAQNLEANATALYRFETDSLAGRTHGVDLSTAVDWRLGYFTLRFEAEYDLLDLPDSRDNSMAFWIKLRREIPLISKKPQ